MFIITDSVLDNMNRKVNGLLRMMKGDGGASRTVNKIIIMHDWIDEAIVILDEVTLDDWDGEWALLMDGTIVRQAEAMDLDSQAMMFLNWSHCLEW